MNACMQEAYSQLEAVRRMQRARILGIATPDMVGTKITSRGRSSVACDENAGIALERLGVMRPRVRKPICLSRVIDREEI